ncbi:MAG: 5'/3'-nucleotidase SurE [Candidatus Nanoarchaeia archaeon]
MRILLTNDDGINAEGLLALYDELSKMADVMVVAPDSERSAVGHGITIYDPLRVKEFYRNGKLIGYSSSGTPADCVKLGVSTLMDSRPDLVISGINAGPNVGVNVLYSGTVSGAMEGALLGIPSMAVSLASWTSHDYAFAAHEAGILVNDILNLKLPRGTLLNVNIPDLSQKNYAGEKITFQSKVAWTDRYEQRTDPGNRRYYWLNGEPNDMLYEEGSDAKAIQDGYVSITPLHCDMTDWTILEERFGIKREA